MNLRQCFSYFNILTPKWWSNFRFYSAESVHGSTVFHLKSPAFNLKGKFSDCALNDQGGMDYFIQPHFHSAQSYAPGCVWSPWHSIKWMNERFFFWNSFRWLNSTQLKFFSFWLDLMYCPCAHLCLCRKSTISQGWARSAAKTRWPGTWTGC